MKTANGGLGTAKTVINYLTLFYYSSLQLLALKLSSCNLENIIV